MREAFNLACASLQRNPSQIDRVIYLSAQLGVAVQGGLQLSANFGHFGLGHLDLGVGLGLGFDLEPQGDLLTRAQPLVHGALLRAQRPHLSPHSLGFTV